MDYVFKLLTQQGWTLKRNLPRPTTKKRVTMIICGIAIARMGQRSEVVSLVMINLAIPWMDEQRNEVVYLVIINFAIQVVSLVMINRAIEVRLCA